jgi:acyl-CoA dehydrogenase
MDTAMSRQELRGGVRKVCANFPDSYWRELDAKREYPEEFVRAMTEAGYLGALIPEEYGGMGLGLAETTIILEEINRSGGNAQPAHAQVYTMGTLLRHGSEEQKQEYLPEIASGELRLQAFGITEPEAGTDTTSLRTTAVRSPDGDHYIINGRKIYISRVQHSDYMILLARTTPRDQVKRKSEGLSVFIFDLRQAVGNGLTVKPRRVMINNETNELLFENLRVPANSLIGEEGKGFRYILDGMNAERILIAAECIGNGRWFVDRATRRATERVCGAEANMGLLLAADASWEAANAAMQTFGGYSFDAEYDVERKFRETRLFKVAPISTNLILSYVGEHVLGLPRSF